MKLFIPSGGIGLWVRNIFFTLLQPGIVAGLIPYWIMRNRGEWVFPMIPSWSNVGILIFVPGLIILLSCIADFARKGKGTLSPADPTRKLVVSGLYRYSRNPMYVGVMLMLGGETVFFASWMLAGYSVLIFVLFYAFVIRFEEPRLKKDFGEEYIAYSRSVRRWF